MRVVMRAQIKPGINSVHEFPAVLTPQVQSFAHNGIDSAGIRITDVILEIDKKAIEDEINTDTLKSILGRLGVKVEYV
jgi:hypothetical protein